MKTDDFVSPNLHLYVQVLLDPKSGSIRWIRGSGSDPSSPNREETLVFTGLNGFRVNVFQELAKRGSIADPSRIHPENPFFTGQSGARVCLFKILK